MAEFCPECLIKVFGVNKKVEDYVLSKELYFCEECCQWKNVVVREKDEFYPNYKYLPNIFSFFFK